MTKTAKPTNNKKPAKAPKAAASAPAPKPEKPARITNGDKMAALAAQPNGFSLDDVIAKLGVQPHTARAMISVELRKKRNLIVVLDREAGRYRIQPAA